MVLAYSLDQEEAIQNVFFILLHLVRFLRSSLQNVRKIARFYAFITLGYRQNHKLQPRFVGLGLVVREWYWPIPWTRRKRFRMYFSFCCILHGFGGVVDGKYAKIQRNNNNEPAIRRDLPSLTSGKREAGTSPVVAYERVSDWIKRTSDWI